MYRRILLSTLCAAFQLRAGVAYRVTQGGGACHEIRIPKWTPTKEMVDSRRETDTGFCEYELRKASEAKLYIGLVCPAGHLVWKIPEKYGVNLLHPGKLQPAVAAVWESAMELRRSRQFIAPLSGINFRILDTGLEYEGRLLAKSGPKWAGEGEGDPPQILSPTAI